MLFRLSLIVIFIGSSGCFSGREESDFILMAGGDIMLDRGVRRAAPTEKDLLSLFTGIAPTIQKADLAFANLECPLVAEGVPVPKKFSFRCDPAAATSLRKAGFDALSLANNHSCDYGRTGLMATIRELEQAEIVPLGAGENQEAAVAARYFERHGIRVAAVAVVDLAVEGILSSLTDFPAPAFAQPERMKAAIAAARQNSDYVVVTVHWGREYERYPTERQRQLARQMASAGADLIVGHHPHVLQTIEPVGGAVVFYSLGNLVFDQAEKERSQSILLRVMLGKNLPPRLAVLPLRLHHCRPSAAEAEEKEEILKRLEEISPGVSFRPLPDNWAEVQLQNKW